MGDHEKYLKPSVIQEVSRLDLKARFIVEGFLAGMHRSPYHGFSVEFSEHRRYARGDSPRTIDWRLFGRTDRLYVKKFEAETNLRCHLVLDTSASMDFTYEGKLTKLDYSICLAAALAHLLIRQRDPVGLVTVDDRIRAHLEPRSRSGHLTDILAVLARARGTNPTRLAESLHALASLFRRRGLVLLFTDLFEEEAGEEGLLSGLHELVWRGHEVILFHVLDAAEVEFPYRGAVHFTDCETGERLTVDAPGVRKAYRERIEAFRARWEERCGVARVDYVPLDTGMPFDRALVSYLVKRQERF